MPNYFEDKLVLSNGKLDENGVLWAKFVTLITPKVCCYFVEKGDHFQPKLNKRETLWI